MMVHVLKTWPNPFEQVWIGRKPFEIRKDDRGYEVGDTLRLREYVPPSYEDGDVYTGREVRVLVTYLVRDAWGLPPGLVVMGWSHRTCSTNTDVATLYALGGPRGGT